ncbi:hypothetical protein L211DRAFT_659303 [Terfezia boudieri ATCC MYA-4762]|uniref:Ras modification protein ERF4 n=1 Tax=Terfezia boudieri ATCC MYA-4762 TaxID=1051890 RepID=A0A3N4LVP5_9PEZI|nr:hypothetical protein L211DRAFT_659303 [Terfezia boudieri ATCC MYA-4762]
MATTTNTKVRKPEPPVLHQETTPAQSTSRGIFPIPNLRRHSQHGGTSPHPGQEKPVPSSPPIANRRLSAAVTNPPTNRLSQSLFADAAGIGGAEGTDQHGVDWDLEKGVKLEDLRAARAKKEAKRKSMLDGDGTRAGGPDARSSSSRPSTLHEEEEEDDWNHEHPCFPHPNPHVPLDSPLFQSTRIIRIPRDYMINGDNTPAFSIVYPVILEPYVTEEQFRKIVDTVNEKMRLAFDPWNKWNWVDAVCGLATLWFWEEIFPTYVKRRLREVEKILEEWNVTLKEQGARLIPLRRSAYITLDIQIPDPLREDSEDGSVLNQERPSGENGAVSGTLTKEAEAGARTRTLSTDTIPTLKINGDFHR